MPSENIDATNAVAETRKEPSWRATLCGALLGLSSLIVFSVFAIALGLSFSAHGGSPPHAMGVIDIAFLMIVVSGTFFFCGFAASRLTTSRTPLVSALTGMSAWALLVVSLTVGAGIFFKDPLIRFLDVMPGKKTPSNHALHYESKKKNEDRKHRDSIAQSSSAGPQSTSIPATEARGAWTLFFTLLLSGLASWLGGLIGFDRSIAGSSCTLQTRKDLRQTPLE
jgi:hypothetical protein